MIGLGCTRCEYFPFVYLPYCAHLHRTYHIQSFWAHQMYAKRIYISEFNLIYLLVGHRYGIKATQNHSLFMYYSCWQNVILILLWPIFTLIMCETHKNPKIKKEWNHVFYIVINMMVAPTLIGSNFKKVAPLILKEACRFLAALSIDVLWFEIQRWPYKIGFITLVLR